MKYNLLSTAFLDSLEIFEDTIGCKTQRLAAFTNASEVAIFTLLIFHVNLYNFLLFWSYGGFSSSGSIFTFEPFRILRNMSD